MEAPYEVREAAREAYINHEGYGRVEGFNAAADFAYAAGRAAAADALPSSTDDILAWLARHGLSTTPGVGVVLAAIRADLSPTP